VKNEVQQILEDYKTISESASFDTNYLQGTLKGMADDGNEEDDSRLPEFYNDLADRINQTNPDGDLTVEDVLESIRGNAIESKYKKDVNFEEEIQLIFDAIG
jgi:hypothetical protein